MLTESKGLSLRRNRLTIKESMSTMKDSCTEVNRNLDILRERDMRSVAGLTDENWKYCKLGG